jgi:hypothetical protein
MGIEMSENKQRNDGRVYRLWYLPYQWSNIKSKLGDVTDWSIYVCGGKNAANLASIHEQSWDDLHKFPYIFLSRSPLTFGHSQLVIPAPPGSSERIPEAKYFEWASHIIREAIATFTTVFKDHRVLLKTFENLANLTQTKGKYIKTLILKASADEKIEEVYKVHLVPYFKSHDTKCKWRFCSKHGILPGRKGGLLGWLGEREDEVDKWEAEPTPLKCKLDDIANDDLKMQKLATTLWERWPKTPAGNKTMDA